MASVMATRLLTVLVIATAFVEGDRDFLISINSTLELNCTLSDTRVAPNVSINGTYLGVFNNFTSNLSKLGIHDNIVRDDKHVLVVTIIINVRERNSGTLIMCTDDSTSYRIIAQGRLPPPENVTISSKNSTTIHLEWTTPYFAINNASDAEHEINNKSDIVHVNPHITQYTVYISSSTGRNSAINVTEVQYTFRDSQTTENDLCSTFVFSVSAWNAGGEGEMSESVTRWGSLLHDCQVSTDTSTTATSTTATSATATASTTATNGTEGDTTATIDGNQEGDYTTIIIASVVVLVVVTIIVIILWRKCNVKAD